MSGKFSKIVRMWHKNGQGQDCHAWDVEEKHYQSWKQMDTPLKAAFVILPSGKSPEVRSRVVCGTCGQPVGPPSSMRTETIRTSM